MIRLVDAQQLADALGVTRRIIYRWTEEGTLPHLKIGRLVRFDEAAVEAWLASHRHGDWSTHRERRTAPSTPNGI